ncbi:MAG: hypothetical protein IKT41_04425 [Clostridia bacterium]|nr:hypothetical protein [Clostridia bacterium]
MPTKTIIQKYASILENMEQDAMHNVNNVHEDLAQRRKELEFANGELNRLNDVMEDNHRGFWEAAKTIIKMIFKRPDNPKEIESMLVPIINYKNALENVPSARLVCEAALKSEQTAVAECTKAEKLLNRIRSIRTL